MTKIYRVHNLCCANCAAQMERALNKLDGVNCATVNFFAQKITLDIDDKKSDDVIPKVCKVFKKIEPEMTYDTAVTNR